MEVMFASREEAVLELADMLRARDCWIVAPDPQGLWEIGQLLAGLPINNLMLDQGVGAIFITDCLETLGVMGIVGDVLGRGCSAVITLLKDEVSRSQLEAVFGMPIPRDEQDIVFLHLDKDRFAVPLLLADAMAEVEPGVLGWFDIAGRQN